MNRLDEVIIGKCRASMEDMRQRKRAPTSRAKDTKPIEFTVEERQRIIDVFSAEERP